MDSKKKQEKNSKKKEEIETVPFSNPPEVISTLLNFSRLTKRQRLIVIITIIIVSIYPLWRVTEGWRNQYFVKEKIHDYFVSEPSQHAPCINVAIFQLKKDKIIDNELSIQDLFISKFQYPFINYTKYSLPIDPNDNDRSKELLKQCKKKYDIVIWGNSVWRDGSKKYKLNYSTATSDILTPEFSLSDGEFPQVCYQKLNAIIPSVILKKIERLELLDENKYEEKSLSDFFFLLRTIIQNEEIMKSVSDENKSELYQKLTSIGCVLSKMGKGKFYIEEPIKYLEQILQSKKDFDCELLLGKTHYELGIEYFSHDDYELGISCLNNSIQLLRGTLSEQLKAEKKWEKTASWMSEYLPKKREIRQDSLGKSFLYVETNTDVANELMRTALITVNSYEMFRSRREMCQGYLGQSLFELGKQKNDSILLSEAKEMLTNCMEERKSKHYMQEYDFNMYSPLTEMDDIYLNLITLVKDTVVIMDCLKRQACYFKTLDKDKPYQIAKICFMSACLTSQLGQIELDSFKIMMAIDLCSSVLNDLSGISHEKEWYNCNKKIAEYNLFAYLLSNKMLINNKFISESIKHYQILLDYCLKKGLFYEYANNMLNLAVAILIDFQNSKDISITKANIDIYKKQSKSNDDIYTVDSYATIKLADGIISLLQNNIDGQMSHLYEAQNFLREAETNFSHPCSFPKKAILYSLSSLVKYRIWNCTKKESELLVSKQYREKSLHEYSKFSSLINNTLMINELKQITLTISSCYN